MFRVVPSPLKRLFCNFEAGKIYPEFIVGTISGGLKILRLKPEGKNEMDSYSFLRGQPDVVGTFLKY